MDISNIKVIDISIIKNQWSYEPPAGYVGIYRHMCQNPEDLTYKAYIGRTDTSMKNRAGVYFKNYHYQGTGAGTKFERYLNKYGCLHIKSELLYVVPEAYRLYFEQLAIDENQADSLGYNTYKAIIERKTTNTRKFVNKVNEKNNPTIQGAEDLSITFNHRGDIAPDKATINIGLYDAKYRNKVLYLDHPGIDGTVTLKTIDRVHTTVLQELSKDIGFPLKFGPAGRHTITLDNIYKVGTRVNVRTLLIQDPKLREKVPYLKIEQFED